MKDSIQNIIGDYGEKIIIDRIKYISDFSGETFITYNIMTNIYKERHFYDLMIQKWVLDTSKDFNKLNYKQIDNSISKIDVKTFPPLIKYPEFTGINETNWLEYQQIPELLILFVDPKNYNIYGDFVYNLTGQTLKTGPNEKQDRIVFERKYMKNFGDIFNDIKINKIDNNKINQLRDSQKHNFNELYRIQHELKIKKKEPSIELLTDIRSKLNIKHYHKIN